MFMFTLLKAKNVLEKLESFIQQHQLFEFSDQLAIAVSGGKDSVFAAYALDKLGYTFKIVHCNFKLRGNESDEDERFVENLAATLPQCNGFISTTFNTIKIVENQRSSTQIIARELRYEYFEKLHKNGEFDYLITAHHQDDSLETFFINLYRGSGVKGLSGIPFIRDFYRRPLLALQAEEIQNYLKGENIEYREDSSNKESYYLRNKIRNDVLPRINRLIPDFKSRALNSITYLREEDQILAHLVSEIEEKHSRIGPENSFVINIQPLTNYPQAHVILYRILDKFSFNVDQCKQILDSKSSGKEFHSASYKALKDRDELKVLPITEYHTLAQVQIHGVGSFLFGEYTVVLENINKDSIDFTNEGIYYIDKDKIKFPLILRTWQQADKMRPLGMHGQKLLSDIFTELKLDNWEKNQIPILLEGESVLWVMGYRIADTIKISESTTSILGLHCFKS